MGRFDSKLIRNQEQAAFSNAQERQMIRSLQSLKYLALALGLVSGLATASYADIVVEATDNSTIQPGGPRQGGSGDAFFNIEGTANGNFASYGVIDFTFDANPLITSVDAVEISFTQSNAGFTADGSLQFWADSVLVDDINSGDSPLAFDSNTTPGTAQDVTDGDLALTFLGDGSFVEVEDGFVDTFSLSPLSDVFLSTLQNGGTLRLIVTPNDADVAATWAGFTNDTYAGPTLSIQTSAVPEPSSVAVLCGLGVAAFGYRTVRRRANKKS